MPVCSSPTSVSVVIITAGLVNYQMKCVTVNVRIPKTSIVEEIGKVRFTQQVRNNDGRMAGLVGESKGRNIVKFIMRTTA